MEERYFTIYVNPLPLIYSLDHLTFDISIPQGEEPDQYVLILCNAIGNPVDSKYVKTQPLHVAMNLVSNPYLHFVAASIWGLKDMPDRAVVDIEQSSVQCV